ncbi:hypothetical protein BN175_1450004 [Clostridioides difficile T23]|uniref:Uncharacterized protein n=1 Tax=Clostridioides difficile TaxID=1496 RepID=A0A069AEI6_CLODI|nr:hypothetical protein BN163_1130004 [Clostridioides difficile T5]CCK90579.1 hypothetical protein BN164_1020004 [Clostridioides difficile T20]CCL02129.1 hypothetical protein BN167_1270013 [Clostridioides difficile E13]CCL11280.1 hypothetical protein BN169_710037 [Clostridioides difficile E16]CCL14093.1 hypothetical protein BN170_1620004 [Clostridioides difficile T22]CCL34033.1 hypothetical protein BN175_1450004 [Clostridioides difficile T23]CCL37854.1 hypothetical protein BN176_1680012 [Clos
MSLELKSHPVRHIVLTMIELAIATIFLNIINTSHKTYE